MKVQQLLVLKGLDQDTTDQELEPGMVRFALNCDIYNDSSSNLGATENKSGNVLVQASLPFGENVCIGKYEDKRDLSLIYFIYNSGGDHTIYRYYLGTGVISLVLRSPLLRFQKDEKITGVRLQDDLLYFTDGFSNPRKLNIAKAINDKIWVGHVYFGTDKDESWQDGNEFSYTSPLAQTGTGVLFITSGLSGLGSLITAFTDAFNAGGFNAQSTQFLARAKGTYVEITATGPGNLGLELSSTKGLCRLVWQNIYMDPFEEDYIQLVKYPPQYPLTYAQGADTVRKVNYLLSKTFQFRHRYVYDDSEKSVWSPITPLAYTLDPSSNYFTLSFNSEHTDTSLVCIVKRVEIAFREGNLGKWKMMCSMDQWEFISGRYDFYNDGIYSALEDAEMVKPYDAVPVKSKSLELVKDRLFLAGNTEGMDAVDVNTDFQVGFSDATEQKTWTIKGKVYVINPYQGGEYGTHQPIHDYGHGPVFGGIGQDDYIIENFSDNIHSDFQQNIPEGGFIIYLAGTPYYGISRQPWDYFDVSGAGVGCSNGAKSVEKKNSSPIVYDSTDRGLPPAPLFCRIKSKFRTAIRQLMGQHRTYSDFEIKNVPPGRYILRAASHWCSYGDKLGKGSMYDLNNGLEWQKTSTNVATMAGVGGAREYVLELGEEGGVFDLWDLSNTGRIEIEDMINPTSTLLPDNSCSMSGYLIDSAGSTNNTDMAEGSRMEYQRYDVTFDGVPSRSGFTDHNGFFYFGFEALGAGIGLAVIRAKFSSVNNQVLKDYNQEKFQGSLNDLALKTLSTDKFDIDFHSSGEFKEYIVVNRNSDFGKNYSTYVESGFVAGSSPIKDVLVLMARCGRWEKSDALGSIRLLVYPDAQRNLQDRAGFLLWNFLYIKGSVTGGVTESFLNIAPLSATGYNRTTHYGTGTFSGYVVSLSGGTSFFKRGGLYKFGIVYYNKALQCTHVNTSPNMKVYIPHYNEDLSRLYPNIYQPNTFKFGTPYVQWHISHEPPMDADLYSIVVTENLNFDFYLQWLAEKVRYVEKMDADTVTETTYKSGVARFIFLDLANFKNYREDNYINDDKESQPRIGYTFTPGDRLRIIKDSGQLFFTEVYDVAIKELRGTELVIEILETMPELKAGTFMEIYTPGRKIDEEIYYEIGAFYPVRDAGTLSAAHSQTNGLIQTGDTYMNIRKVSVSDPNGSRNFISSSMESPSVSDFYDSRANHKGRPNIVDKDRKKMFYKSGIRHSNVYITDTQVNGLSSFEPANNLLLPKDFGLVEKLQASNIGDRRVLLAIQQTETLSLYIGEAQINDVVGHKLLAIANEVISTVAVLMGGWGTLHPESVVEKDGRVYFFSAYDGKAVRYSSDGLFPVSSYKMSSYFRNISREMLDGGKAYGGWDPFTHEYVLTFDRTKDNVRTRETLAFNTVENKWSTFYSFTPEHYALLSTEMVSFIDGKLYVHYRNPLRNSFYGVQYSQVVEWVFNQDAKNVKVWKVLSMKSTETWRVPQISNPPTQYNPNGQLSNLIEADFTLNEGVLWAAILRDETTPNVSNPLIEGENMRSEVLYVRMENNSVNQVVLHHIYIQGFLSTINL